MDRRAFLLASSAVVAGRAFSASPSPAKSTFGICIYSYGATRKFSDTLAFLDHCNSLGAAGIQMQLTSLDLPFAEKVKTKAAEYGMYYEGIVTMPKPLAKDDSHANFEQQLIAAKAAGARLVRSACLGSRRYETFKNLEDWKAFVQDSHEALDAALPLLEKHQITLALENHKDWTIDEMIEIQEKHKSDYFGSCLDFGNNLALLDSPESAMKLAPYAVATHVKDIQIGPDPLGFRMAEAPIGTGIIDVRGIVQAIRKVRPDTKFTLEMITRDPLMIPCDTVPYWATFPDRGGIYLARMLEMVRERGKTWMDRVSHEAPAFQAKLADDNLKSCLDAGRGPLAI
jgi:sugar phosphate isomerase/epimerase